MTGTVRTWSAPHSAVERPRLFALHGMRCNRSGAERSADQGSRPRHHSLPGDTVRSCRRRTLEVHNEAAFENAFRCRSVALSAAPLIIGKVKEIGAGWPICVVSPDLGGGKRADLLREVFERAVGHPVGKAFVEKHRSSGVVSGDLFAGDVANMLCVVVDDLVSTGGTLVRAAKAAPAHGAQEVIACVAHGLFMPGVESALADFAIDRIIVTDSVPAFRLPPGPVLAKLEIISAAPLFAETIRRLHHNEPLADLLLYQV